MHQLLIGCAMVLFCVFAARSLWQFSGGAGTSELVVALGAGAAGAAAGLYLRQFRKKLRAAQSVTEA